MTKISVETELGMLKAELAEMQQSFDLRWNADMRAIKRWQEAHPGNELMWPDHADLCIWLMEQTDQLRDLVVRYRSEHDKAADDRSGRYIDYCLCSVCSDVAEVLEKGNHA